MRARALLTGSLLVGLYALSAPRALHAAEPAGEQFPDAKPPLGLLPTPEDALIDPRMARSWATLPSRQFVATSVDLGFVYIRPRLSLGYGRPFTQWVGVDINPIASQDGLGAYGGFRLELPYVDFRVGQRYFSAFQHTTLDAKPSYSRLDLENSSGKRARTFTSEAELDITLPAGPGKVLLRGGVSYISGVPSGESVYEETLHLIVAAPVVWRARVGYVFTFGSHGQHSLGPVVDFLSVPKRDDSSTLRAGPLLRLALSRRVDIRGSFVVTIISPDRIGLKGGDFTELGVRYRWASE